MDLKEKKVLVVGLAKTGEALCDFLLKRGAAVTVSEKKTPEEIGPKLRSWTQRGVHVETSGHNRKTFLNADLIVPSPGVPFLSELVEAQNHGIKIISEVELAYRFLKGNIVGITGSNGKSTTATLVHKILDDAGLKAYLAGNIKTPLIKFVENSRDDHIYVTELSSFQLKHTERFKASISVFLNVTPDHLDWHRSFDDYYESKKKLIFTQTEGDKAVLNRDDPLVWSLHKGNFQTYAFSREKKVSQGCYIENDWIILSDDQETKLIEKSKIPLLGIHNQENVMASALVGYLSGLPVSKITSSIQTFKGLPHRLEKVSTLREVEYYNDSKATNVDATLKSIQSFNKKIILILGGRDKGGEFGRLRGPIKGRVKKIILIGEASEKITQTLKNSIPMNRASSLQEAVHMGFDSAEPGEVVLLAPACTSFDMFQNFEERGDIFKQEVLSLKTTQSRRKI